MNNFSNIKKHLSISPTMPLSTEGRNLSAPPNHEHNHENEHDCDEDHTNPTGGCGC